MRARTLTWAGIILAGGLVLIAAWWYPGESAGFGRGQSTGGDFLSMMGRTRIGARENTFCCVTFNGALIVGGVVLAVFWKARALFLASNLVRIVQTCGQMMGIGVAGVGLAPCDLVPVVHDTVTYLVLVLGVICFGLCLAGSHREFESRPSKMVWLAVLPTAAAAVGFFLLLRHDGTIPNRSILPLIQKFCVLALALWAAWQSYLLGRAIESAAMIK